MSADWNRKNDITAAVLILMALITVAIVIVTRHASMVVGIIWPLIAASQTVVAGVWRHRATGGSR